MSRGTRDSGLSTMRRALGTAVMPLGDPPAARWCTRGAAVSTLAERDLRGGGWSRSGRLPAAQTSASRGSPRSAEAPPGQAPASHPAESHLGSTPTDTELMRRFRLSLGARGRI